MGGENRCLETWFRQMISKAESMRLHLDWWGNCRTCRFWHGTDKVSSREGAPDFVQPRWNDSPCTNPKSPLFGQECTTEGECKKWDSFDVDVALEALVAP